MLLHLVTLIWAHISLLLAAVWMCQKTSSTVSWGRQHSRRMNAIFQSNGCWGFRPLFRAGNTIISVVVFNHCIRKRCNKQKVSPVMKDDLFFTRWPQHCKKEVKSVILGLGFVPFCSLFHIVVCVWHYFMSSGCLLTLFRREGSNISSLFTEKSHILK